MYYFYTIFKPILIHLKKILVTRFSSMGDVAMTVPVLKNVLNQNHDLEIIFVSRPFFDPFFQNIERLSFLPIDLNKDYKGIYGLYRLSKRLKKERFDAYIDLHNVLRTKVIRFFLYFSVDKIACLNKGRKEKKKLTRKKNKILRPLKTSFERYADVFRKLNIPVNLKKLHNQKKTPLSSSLREKASFDPSKKHLGIAPFAKHKAKMYPVDRIKKVIVSLSKNDEIQIFLFGGGEEEQKSMEKIAKEYPNTINLAGKMDLYEELALISHLDLMFSMDSANMHLASLLNIPVVSFWGATHPYAGFMGYGQTEKNAIQRNLSCRPCSVYGNKLCWRGDWACLEVREEKITEKIKNTISM